jgi:hypothetical protein
MSSKRIARRRSGPAWIALAAAAALIPPPSAAEAPTAPPAVERIAEKGACARPSGAQADWDWFARFLHTSCSLARRHVERHAETAPRLAAAAERYLERLSAFDSAAEGVAASRVRAGLGPRPLTNSGAYLIAQRLGVLKRFSDWRKTYFVYRANRGGGTKGREASSAARSSSG